jgi:hypothetical protein
MTTLFVIDSLSMLARIPRTSTGTVLGFGIEYDDLTKALSDEKRENLTAVNVDSFEIEANRQVRSFYDTVIMDSWKNDREASSNEKGVYLPYLIDITENSPFKGKLTNRLFNLSLYNQARNSSSYDKLEVLIRDKTLKTIINGKSRVAIGQTLKVFFVYWAQCLRFLTKGITLNLLIKLRKFEFKSGHSTFVIFSIFPYWWLNATSHYARERFFPDLDLEKLRAQGSYLVWLESPMFEIGSKLSLLSNLLTKHRVILLNNYLDIRSYMSVFSITDFTRILRFKNRVLHNNNFMFQKSDVSVFIKEDILNSLGQGEFTRSRLILLAVRRYLSVVPTKALIFRFENQPIDRSIIMASKGLTKSIAYWHSSLSECENFLSLRNIWPLSALSLDEGTWGTNTPNFVFVPNDICKESIIKHGMLSTSVFNIGPTRHLEPLNRKEFFAKDDKNSKSAGLSSENSENVIVLICSADRNISQLLLQTSLKVISKFGKVKIRIKLHPAWVPKGEFLKMLEQEAARVQIMDVKEDIYQLISQASYVISAGTQLIFESILLDTVPIVYEPSSSFNPTKFTVFEKSCFIVNSEVTMHDALDQIMSGSEALKDKMLNWPKLIQEVFGSPNLANPYEDLDTALNVILNRLK